MYVKLTRKSFFSPPPPLYRCQILPDWERAKKKGITAANLEQGSESVHLSKRMKALLMTRMPVAC